VPSSEHVEGDDFSAVGWRRQGMSRLAAVPTDNHQTSNSQRFGQALAVSAIYSYVALIISVEARMAFDPKTYQDGFTAGWLAAFRAISETTSRIIHPTSVPLAMAGAAPARRRGRPPKSASAAQPIKRRRGRPRKTETSM
jgi:hypothetical protein